MSLFVYAERELDLAGLFDKDSDYNGMLGEATLELISTFANQGHSGFSAGVVRDLFAKLSAYEPLTPIGTTKNEWIDVSEASGRAMWQNSRDPKVFSYNAGRTWYRLDDPRWHQKIRGWWFRHRIQNN